MPTGTLGTQARDYPERQVFYLHSGILQTSTGNNFTAIPSTTSIKMGVIPANSSIIRANLQVAAVNNAGTSNVSIGTTSGGTDIVAIVNQGQTLGFTALTLAASSVPVLVAADTTVWVTNQSTGATATTGILSAVVEFVVNGSGGSPLT